MNFEVCNFGIFADDFEPSSKNRTALPIITKHQRLQVIGKSLQKLRLKSGYSQEEVAERLNITSKSYGAYEQGTSTPDILRLIQIAEIFECELDELLVGISSKPDDQAKHIASLLQGVKRTDRLHIVRIVEKICLISKGKSKINS